jgi:3-isopropylmalate/(R)-2-methylmalate dehydratase small subunit
MEPFRIHRGKVVPLDRQNVDTDQIIPKQFLKRIERTGYGDFLFIDWRQRSDGSKIESFILNDPHYSDGSILVAGRNFGCGSSREHAAWALMNYGFRAVIAPTFADIFLSNAGKNGLLTIQMDEATVSKLIASATKQPGYEITIDLERKSINDGSGWQTAFAIDEFRRKCLLEGADDIALTLQHENDISLYEANSRS